MSYAFSALIGIIIAVASYCTTQDPQPTPQKEESHVTKDAQR
jgi:hypothetical protein